MQRGSNMLASIFRNVSDILSLCTEVVFFLCRGANTYTISYDRMVVNSYKSNLNRVLLPFFFIRCLVQIAIITKLLHL